MQSFDQLLVEDSLKYPWWVVSLDKEGKVLMAMAYKTRAEARTYMRNWKGISAPTLHKRVLGTRMEMQFIKESK